MSHNTNADSVGQAKAKSWLTQAQAAKLGQVGQATVSRWCNDEAMAAQIGATKVGGRWRIDPTTFKRFLSGADGLAATRGEAMNDDENQPRLF